MIKYTSDYGSAKRKLSQKGEKQVQRNGYFAHSSTQQLTIEDFKNPAHSNSTFLLLISTINIVIYCMTTSVKR